MRILVVDDDYVSRTKLKALLADWGDCDAVPNGTIALEMFRSAHSEQVPYELVTMDVNMPDMKGQEVVAQIRQWEKDNGQNHQAKILMITALKGGQEVMSAFREGCEWYLVKPVTPENLSEAMGKLEEAHNQRIEVGQESSTLMNNLSFPDPKSIEPSDLEEEFWSDYYTSVCASLEKLEAAAMNLESGDEKQGEAIKRLLHSIKGESGMIGLNDVQQVVHDAETAFEELGPNTDAADMVLTVKDWVETVTKQIDTRLGAETA